VQEASIHASKLGVEKEGLQVLEELSFVIRKGTLTGLIGPSGSGKTTLMRSIVGVQKITTGSLEVLGESAGSATLRKRIGYVTQNVAIYDDLTIEQNLLYFARLVGAKRAQVTEIIEQIQLTEQRKRLARNLSGGQRARLSLAVALLGDPDLLVLDEPTVGLDPLLRQELWKLFASLAKKGKTLLISSHVMDEAERCDSLLLLRGGKLLWNGPRQQLLEHTHETSVEGAFISMVKQGEKK
jgi:ABC-2 type transport system ATP-binding protein